MRTGIPGSWPLRASAALAVAVLAALLATLGPEAGAQPLERSLDTDPEGAPYAAGELLVSYEDSAAADAIENVNRQAGGRTLERLPGVQARLVSFPEIKNERAREARQRGLERRRQALERSPLVEAADYNYLREPSYTPDDEYFDRQWSLETIEAPRAWDRERGGGARVAVVDTGMDQDHPDLAGKVAAQRDFVDDDSTAQDDDGHGTHVAGTAAAATDNGRGVAGACPDCELLVAKTLTASGGFDSDIAEGIIWSVDNGADSVNLSLGGPRESRTLEDAVNYAWNNGAVVAAAAGNSGTNDRSYPAAYENAIAVTATDENEELASFSNYGDWVDAAAPGVGILSTVPGGYQEYSGTSMATPHVAALAGLLSAQGLGAAENRQRIESSAADLGPSGKDEDYGQGRINAREALGVEADTGSGEEAGSGATSRPAVYGGGQWRLRETLDSGAADLTYSYGGTTSDTEPLMGDWDGDGTKTPGIARGNTFYLKNTNSGGGADISFRFGVSSDTPVVGDWDGDGRDTIGVVRGNRWLLSNSNEGGKADTDFRFGVASDAPIAGDWNGDGTDAVGIVRGNTFYLKDTNSGGEADTKLRFGNSGDKPVVGDWDGDSRDTIGVVRGRDWYLRNTNSGGFADIGFSYEEPGDVPLVW